MATGRIRVLLADDHKIVIDGLNLLLKDVNDIDIVDEAYSGDEVLQILARRDIDIVLLDLYMPNKSGLETMAEINVRFANVKVLILTSETNGNIINSMIDAGAYGYVSKTSSRDELLLAIKKVYNGQKYFSSDVSEIMMETVNTKRKNIEKSELAQLKNGLTLRELQIIRLICQGLSNNQIGDKLNRSPRTVDTHRTNIMKKLNVHSATELYKFASENGLLN